jgi:hypothetical protein
LGAALLAIAAGIKGYPLAFFGWFALRRDVRMLWRGAAASAGVMVLLPALAMGPAHALFFQRVSTNAVLGASEGVSRDFNSQYAPAVLARYHGGWDWTPPALKQAAIAGSWAALFGILALLAVVAWTTSPTIAKRRGLFAFALCATTVPFWLPTSWAHYFVHLPLAQVLALDALLTRPRPSKVLACAVLVAPSIALASAPTSLWRYESWWYYANEGAPFFANALAIAALAFAVVASHAEAREGVR